VLEDVRTMGEGAVMASRIAYRFKGGRCRPLRMAK